MRDDYEIVVAGGGIAGLTAALTAARLGRSTLVLTGGVPGGLLLSIETIEGLAGFPDGIAGYELCPLIQEQAAAAGADISMTELDQIEPDEHGWQLGGVSAGAVILATGSRLRELDVPGVKRFQGHGVSHCASCDGPLLRDQVVGVIGGGDSACQEALKLADFASQVIIFHRGRIMSAQATYQDRVFSHPKITILFNHVVEQVLGEEQVTGVTAHDITADTRVNFDLAAVFIYVGLTPNSQCVAKHLRLAQDGRIPTDEALHTECPGLLAAGIVRSGSVGQAGSAVGDGVTAAISANRYLTERLWPTSERFVAAASENGGSSEQALSS